MTILYDDAVNAEFGTINVKTYGAKGDGTTNDAPAIQEAINAAKSLGASLTFSPGRYLVNSNLILPSGVASNAGYNRWFRIYGNNASIITTTSGVTILDRHVTALTDGHRGDFWNPIITDLHLSGVPGAHAVRIDRSASVLLQNLWLYNFDKGIELVFALYPRLQSINAQAVERAFRILSGQGIFSDGGIDNSSSNLTRLSECRAQTFTTTSVPFYIEQSQMVQLDNCVAEGSSADVACHINSINGGISYFDNVILNNFWTEYTTSLNKILEIKSQRAAFTINNLVLPNLSPSTYKVLDAHESKYSSFKFDGATSWERLNPSGAIFLEDPSGYNRWSFLNYVDVNTTNTQLSLWDPTRWVSGILPYYRDEQSLEKWRNIDLGYSSKGWVASGATPPVAGSGIYAGRDTRSVLFTSGNSVGYANSRAEYVVKNIPMSNKNVHRIKADVQFSRPLVGAEELVVFYTGEQASNLIRLNATNTSGNYDNWITHYSAKLPGYTAASQRLVCYLNGAIESSGITIFIANQELQKMMTAADFEVPAIKSLSIGGDWFTLPVNNTAPSVSGYSYCKTANNTSTTYSNFSGGYAGQQLYVKLDTNSIVQHGSTIRLNGAANFQPSGAGGMLTLLNDTGVWYEVARAVY